MSLQTSTDVTRINDEEVLKKLWQETEDFGRKKEIRAHMYKLREARLRDFYNSGELNTEIQRTTKNTHSLSNKSNSMTTHADNLEDHSFLSLKSKEIRDSESPTRDISFKISDKQNVDQGWTVTSGIQKSQDGKTHTSIHMATTSGTQVIEGEKLDYDARAQHKSSIYQEGDEKNFVRAEGDSTNSVIHQEAIGGDDNSNFKVSSTKSSSSSRYMSESKSSSENVEPRRAIMPAANIDEVTTSTNVSTKVFTTDAPKDVKSHPSYVEGNTKVTQETKTLPDGTILTTTKYETKNGNSVETSTHKKYSTATSRSSEQNISSSSSTHVHSSSSRSMKDSKNSTSTSSNNQHAIEYICEPGTNVDVNINIVRDNDRQKHEDVTSSVSTSQHRNTESHYNHTANTLALDERTGQKTQKDVDISPVTSCSRGLVSYQDSLRDKSGNVNYSTMSSSKSTVNHTQDIKENKKVISDQFITTERQHEKNIRDVTVKSSKQPSSERQPKYPPQEFITKVTTEKHTTQTIDDHVNEPQLNYIQAHPQQIYQRSEKAPQIPKAKPSLEPYEQPERHQPIKPQKPELDKKTQPTEGQYDTTYRTDFTNKRISVEVSATHDAFARSLRSVTPERIIRPSSTPKSSSPSLRSSVSPDKNRYPSRSGSPRKSDKFSSSETITYVSSPDRRSPTKSPERITDSNNRRRTENSTKTETYNTNTITKKTVYNGTVDEKQAKKYKPRSPSPISTTTSDFEYIRNTNDIVTDLDEDITITKRTKSEMHNKDTRPTSLDIVTTKKTRKVTERSPTSPLTDIITPRKSPTKEVPRKRNLKSPTKEVSSPSTRPSTVLPEDRPLKRTDTYEERVKQILGITNVTSERRRSSLERNSLKRGSFTKDTTRSPSSPKLLSPNKDNHKNEDRPTQTRKSPEKSAPAVETYPQRKSPTKDEPKISEFPSQIRRSPEKEPLPKYQDEKQLKEESIISQLPSQIRCSPEKQPSKKYPEKHSPTKESPKISEFPSQIRKSPQKTSSILKEHSKVTETTAYTHESPKREGPYEKRTSPDRCSLDGPVSLSELPSQTINTADETLDITRIEKKTIKLPGVAVPQSNEKQPKPLVCGFPSQLRKSPERGIPESYHEKSTPEKKGTTISEYPSQIRKSPEREQLEPYPERNSVEKKESSINEFPSQIRKTKEKAPLEPYPEKKIPEKNQPSVNEFPSQISITKGKAPLEPYPKKNPPEKMQPSVNEFPSQIRKTKESAPLEPYPEKKLPEKVQPSVNEFPSQIRKTKESAPLEPYPEKKLPEKVQPSVNEFPSQIRKTKESAPLEPYPEKKLPEKVQPSVNEFPSQIRKTEESAPLEPYPEKKLPEKMEPSVNEFPSQVRKTKESAPLEPYPEKNLPEKKQPSVNEFPSQIRKSKERAPLQRYPEKNSPQNKRPSINEFPSQVRKSPEREPREPYPQRSNPEEKAPITPELPSQIRKSPEREVSGQHPTKYTPVNRGSCISEFPSQVKPILERKPKKPKDRSPVSDESSSSEEESEIKETVTKNTYTELETRVPVNEPTVTKKFIDQLCREEEIQRTDITKKSADEILEQEILQTDNVRTSGTTVKKDKPQKITKKVSGTDFIEKEKEHVRIKSSTSRREIPKTETPTKKKVEKAPSKKSVFETTTTTTKTSRKEIPKSLPKPKTPKQQPEKNKFIDETEYKTACCDRDISRRDTPTRKPQKPSEKITLWNVEDLDKVKEDGSIHVRTHRIDDTVVKKTSMSIRPKVNDEVRKSKPKEPVIEQPTKKPGPVSKLVEIKPKYTTTVKKTITHEEKLKPGKAPEPATTKKDILTTTITVSPKSRTLSKAIGKITSTFAGTMRSKKVTQMKPESTKSVKLQNGHVSSDTEEEFVVDSLEDQTNEKQRKITRTISDQVIKTTHKAPVRGISKPELGSPITSDELTLRTSKKPEKKCITTKTVIINNRDTDTREIIVDLQRSKSSREPTPDRVCALPVTSDEEGDTPRYPDQISEPDDGNFKRKPKKLYDIPIFEGKDTQNFTSITELEDTKTITEVDKVDETDESLLSVNKKISKFLDTADKLTKEPVKPRAPKVDRPTLLITEDLKSDECLLSVSDKVSKFITTAEQLVTPHALPERPKSPKCKNYPEAYNDAHITTKTTEFTVTVPKGPAPKVKRPDFSQENESIREDESSLSVSDKVTKFINASEKLVTNSNKSVSLSKIDIKPKLGRQPSPGPEAKHQSSPKPIKKYVPSNAPTEECVQIDKEEQIFTRRTSPERLSPSRRSPSLNTGERTPTRRPSNQYASVIKTETTETQYARRDSSPKLVDTTPKSSRKPPQEHLKRDSSPKVGDTTPKSPRRPSQEESKTILSTTCRLRSTESIKKAKAMFENITKDQETVRQRDILSRPSVFTGRKPNTKTDIRDKSLETKNVTTSAADNLKSTRLVMEKIRTKSKSPEKSPENSRSTSPKRYEITRFRSSSPEKAPEIVTTSPKDREPSHDYPVNGDDVPHYMKPLDRSLRPNSPHRDHIDQIKQIPDGDDVPHYMKPLDRSLRPNSPHRDNIEQVQPSQPRVSDQDSTRTTKFGVTLRRTDSGRVVPVTSVTSTEVTTERRKSSLTLEKRVTEEEVEDLFDLEVLEELLEKVVGYELRRKIRTQIRLVKKLISENALEIYISKRKTIPREAITRRGSSPFKTSKPSEIVPKTTDIKKETEYKPKYVRKTSPQRTVVDNKLFQHTDIVNKSTDTYKTTEYQSSYSSERRTSSDYSKTTRTSTSPRRAKSPSKTTTRSSPERKTTRTTVETTPTSKTTTVKTTESIPGGQRTTTTKSTESKTFTSLKKTSPPSKKVVVDEQPEWVKRNNLRKTTETASVVANKGVTSALSSSSSGKKTSVRANSPLKETKPTDIITSSYGVGPTDENGTPLFGLRALRAQNRSEQTSKVQGTVISSQYYSENGEAPVGQVSVTKYSTDPKDLEYDGNITKNQGLTSVTTTQKFGYKDTPSFKSLTGNKKEICDTTETSETTKTTKLNRRGSVKAISQKFIENTVESLKNERQTSYPKAGLILRTSSFRDSSGSGSDDNRETSPADRESESTVTVRTTRISGGETFLTNKSTVSGVQDVITRMKGEEYQEGDTQDDIAARGLLNKFIGSQVILSGLESHHGQTQTSTISSPSSTLRRTTKITTTTTEGGKPTTSTRIFHRPVTEEELASVWDEQTLRLLLDQSTDYEERRIIRARLRQVMAEQEACTELVDKASEEAHQQSNTGKIEEKIETTKESTMKGGTVTTKVTTKFTTQQTAKAKPMSPFAKFRQLDKQNSLNTPPSTPGTPRTPGGTPLFKFTDPALNQSASTIKERLLHWCRMKTKEYENIQLDNFSTSWADGLAFCALIHHFLPDAFDYHALTPKDRKHNFELAFKVADEKADIAPLLDVEDMIETRRPDWKCVFTYVQSIYRRFKDED